MYISYCDISACQNDSKMLDNIEMLLSRKHISTIFLLHAMFVTLNRVYYLLVFAKYFQCVNHNYEGAGCSCLYPMFVNAFIDDFNGHNVIWGSDDVNETKLK